MGTRGLYCAVVDGEFKVAQYGQWDAYPSGQGETIYNFVKALVEGNKVEAFRAALRQLKVATVDEVKALWEQIGADGSGLVNMEVANRMKERHPEFSRDTCADIMQLVLDGKAKAVRLEPAFAGDSLFCEWAYVLDMDNEVLEVYKGFQQAPHEEGRFAKMEVQLKEGRKREYWPVAKTAEFPFKNLPTTLDCYVAICEGEVLDRLANIPQN